MTPINFIATLSPNQHRMLRTWWQFSLVSFFGVIISIVVLQSMQLYALYTAMSENRSLQKKVHAVQSEREPYAALKKEEEALNVQRTKIDRIYDTSERSGTLLAALHATDKKSVHMQSCKLKKSSFELTVQCANTECALNEVTRLRTVKQLHEVNLVSLQQAQKDTSMIATIHGKVHKA